MSIIGAAKIAAADLLTRAKALLAEAKKADEARLERALGVLTVEDSVSRITGALELIGRERQGEIFSGEPQGEIFNRTLTISEGERLIISNAAPVPNRYDKIEDTRVVLGIAVKSYGTRWELGVYRDGITYGRELVTPLAELGEPVASEPEVIARFMQAAKFAPA